MYQFKLGIRFEFDSLHSAESEGKSKMKLQVQDVTSFIFQAADKKSAADKSAAGRFVRRIFCVPFEK